MRTVGIYTIEAHDLASLQYERIGDRYPRIVLHRNARFGIPGTAGFAPPNLIVNNIHQFILILTEHSHRCTDIGTGIRTHVVIIRSGIQSY